jgi:hypothetical protein
MRIPLKSSFLYSSMLFVCYGLLRLPDIFLLNDWASAVCPLDTLYMAKLLFPNQPMTPGLASSVIGPSNSVLIIPPGLYFLAKHLGSVRNIFAFLVLAQWAVPLVLFRLLRNSMRDSTAALVAFFSIFLFTNGHWWSPDFLIQPLLLLSFMLLTGKSDTRPTSLFRLAALGMITGLIMILKHNVGLFWAVAVGGTLLMKSLIQVPDRERRRHRLLLGILIIGLISYGIVFGSKLLYHDEFLYYLVPFFVFWGVIVVGFLRRYSLAFNAEGFGKETFCFTTSAMIIPVGVFVYVGKEIGFSRYWESLFGMGLKYLPIWDPGIFDVTQRYAQLAAGPVNQVFMPNVRGLLYVLLFALPFLINMFIVYKLAERIFRNDSFSTVYPHVVLAPLGIFGILMLFPLEGYHIVSTKISLFLLVGAAVGLRVKNPVACRLLKTAGLLSCLPLALQAGAKPFHAWKTIRSGQAVYMPAPINLAVDSMVSVEVSRQTALLRDTIRGRSYYLVDSSGATLATLLSQIDNHYPNYYLEMRGGILNAASTEAIIQSLRQTEFAVVNTEDFVKFKRRQLSDPYLSAILRFLDTHYREVGRYDRPMQISPNSHILSFLIFEAARADADRQGLQRGRID